MASSVTQQQIDTLLAEISSLKSEITALKGQPQPWQRSHYQHVYRHIVHRIPAIVTEYVGDFDFIDPTGGTLLQMGNCIILRPDPRIFGLGPTYSSSSVRGISWENNPYCKNPKEIIIITDSTYCPTIHHIHKTIRNAIEMENILKALPTMDLSGAHPDFVKQVTEKGLDKYPTYMNVVFAFENITATAWRVIRAIETDYVFEGDYVKAIMEGLMYEVKYGLFGADTSITDDIRTELIGLIKNYKIDEIRAKCLEGLYGAHSSIFIEYTYPYSEIKETLYNHMKGKIGILNRNKLHMGHLVVDGSAGL